MNRLVSSLDLGVQVPSTGRLSQNFANRLSQYGGNLNRITVTEFGWRVGDEGVEPPQPLGHWFTAS